MSAGFTRRQLTLAALALNAVRPVRARLVGDAQLRPRLARQRAGSAPAGRRRDRHRGRADRTARQALTAGTRRRRRQPQGCWATRSPAPAAPVPSSTQALREGIGDGYLDEIDLPGPLDLRLPRGSVARPFNFRARDIEVLRNVPYTEGGRRAHLDIRRPKDRDLSRGPRADPDPRRRLDDRQQGAAGPPPDEPDGPAGLGLRLGELPARAEAPLPDPDRRRQTRDRLGAREHQGVRRRPVVRRHHRRLRRRPPRLARGADARPRRLPARLRGVRHLRRPACVPFYGVYDLGGITEHAIGHRHARPVPRPAGVRQGPAHASRRLRPGVAAGPRQRAQRPTSS